MPDPTTLLGFPPEIVLALIAAYTLVKIVELIVNRNTDRIEVKHNKDDKKTPEP